MPLLGGFFSRKNKASRNSDATSSSTAAAMAAASDYDDGSTLSPTSSYVSPERYTPSSPNGKKHLHPSSAATMGRDSVYPSSSGASSSKLRLFGRSKKSHLGPSTSSTSVNTTHTLPNFNPNSPPRPPYANRVSTSSTIVSDAESVQDTRRLRPPPSKSAIFAAYGDPNGALSTRSLPAHHRRDDPPSPPLPALPTTSQTAKKERPSIFPWSKSNPSTPNSRPSTAKDPIPAPQSSPVEPQRDSSFNLKSFRHVRAPSPSPHSPASSVSPSPAYNPNASNHSLTPPTRPRGASINSESSQRISVAVFREAQARRSLAGSPVLGRSPSPGIPSPAGRRPPLPAQKRRSTGPVGYPSSSDESPSPSEDEDDSDEEYTQRPGGLGRQRTITSRSQAHHAPARPSKAKKAQSELGHGMISASRSPATSPSSRSHVGHGSPSINSPSSSTSYTQVVSSYTQPLRGGDDSDRENDDRRAQGHLLPPRSQSSLSHYGNGMRARASASTSAASPSPAAKRASMTIAIGGGAGAGNNLENGLIDTVANYKRTSRHLRGSSTYSNPAAPPSSSPVVPPPLPKSNNMKPPPDDDSVTESDSNSDSDSDNAPLATLLPPRRPGSAMSSYSTGSRTGTGPASRSNSNLPATNPNARSSTNLPPPSLPRSNNTRSNSNAPAGPAKPLIDIAEITSRPPRLSLGTKNNDDAFTGGGTLLGGTKVDSPISSPNASLLSTSPPALGLGLTSRHPPAKFISPPASPAKEIQATSYFDVAEKEAGKVATFNYFASAPMPIPQRKGTGASLEQGQNQKRDMISERLSRAVKNQLEVPATRPGVDESRKSVSSESTTESSESEDEPTSPPPPASRGREAKSPPGKETSPPPNARGREASRGRGLSVPRSAQRSTASPTPSPGPTPRTSIDLLSSMSSSTLKPSPPDEDLASMLGAAGINLISRGDSDSEWESEEEVRRTREKEEEEEEEREESEEVKEEAIFLPPIPIKERSPPPAFSVTSRPQHPRNAGSSVSSMATFIASPPTATFPTTTSSAGVKTRQRSSTLVPSSTSSTFTFSSPISPSSTSNFDSPPTSPVNGNVKTSGSGSTITASQGTLRPGIGVRQRSTTMVPISSPTASKAQAMPSKPFAAPQRRDSPASSTGDSSSGRAPLTPRDGSEIGARKEKEKKVGREKEKGEWSSGVSGLGGAKSRHVKRKSVNFNDDDDSLSASGKGKDVEGAGSNEERRNERRRREARAAIELGNDINGRGPIVDDDDDDDMPINQTLNARMSAVNPMMAMPMQQQQQQPGWPNMNMNMWPQQGGSAPGMLSPAQFMLPPPQSNDTAFLAAHQQAMMYAKQAYQMAVAQQAMAVAADEWERGSTYGGGGTSVYGGGGTSLYGGGSASVYGAPSSASVMNMPMSSPYGMMGGNGMMGGMGMMGIPSMGGANGWSNGSAMFPPSSRSVYGGGGGGGAISSSKSEYGGGGGGNWSSSRTSYGEFGPSTNSRFSRAGPSRDPGYFPPMPPVPRDRERERGERERDSSARGTAPRARTASQPANPRPGTGQRKAPPPSSWKAGV